MVEKTKLVLGSSIMVSVSKDGHFQKHCITVMGVATIVEYTIKVMTHFCPAYKYTSDIVSLVAAVSTLFTPGIPYSDSSSH